MSPRGSLVLCQDSDRDEPQSLFGLTAAGCSWKEGLLRC